MNKTDPCFAGTNLGNARIKRFLTINPHPETVDEAIECTVKKKSYFWKMPS